MTAFRSVAFRLWLIITFAIVVVTGATALQTRDLLINAPTNGSPSACVPLTVSKTTVLPFEARRSADVSGQPVIGCTSWESVGRRALLAAAICAFAGLVILGFFWIGAAAGKTERQQ